MGAAFRYNASVIGVGQVVSSKYRLLRLVGDGGMGSVYEAQHEVLGTRVAIKVLHPELTRRSGLIDRFLQEAKVAAQIRSPHVVQVTDVERTSEGLAYIVMELLQGEPLSTVLERERKLPIPAACDYARQILEALEAAHALGVTHRDLKPENVFVTFVAGKPVLKLIDFGIAKLRSADTSGKHLTVAGVVMGTAEYMAPEQAFSADRADARSDVYAVGVMLYEMIAGVRPVDGEGDARLIAARVERGDVKPLVHAAPDVPRELAGLVHRAMAARPEMRFASATEMRLALEKVSLSPDGPRVPTRPLPAGTQAVPLGPGTVLGAPAEAVFTPSPALSTYGSAPPGPMAHGTGTVYGATPPPGDAAYGPPAAYGSAPLEQRAEQRAPQRRSRSPWWWLLVPAFLGIGALVTFLVIYYQNDGSHPTTTATETPTETASVSATATVTESTAAATQAATLPPLGSSKPVVPTAKPVVTAKPSASSPAAGSGSAAASSSGAKPFPSGLPFPLPSMSGIPSSFPLPSAFPSTLFPPAPPPLPPPASS